MSCNSKRLLTCSRYFCLSKFRPSKVFGCKKKNQVTFFMISFKNNLFSKISYMRGCFGLFTKLKRCMKLVFTAGFLYTFSIKMFLIKYYTREWPSRLKHYNQNWKVFRSNPTRHSAGFFKLLFGWLRPALGIS